MPVQPNVFKLEITPPVPVLDPDKSFEMRLKNLATTKQRVIVSVESYLFTLSVPTAKRFPLSQTYCYLEPGETLSFLIRATDSDEYGQKEVVSRMTKPEGKLRIYHQTTDQKTDSTDHWIQDYYEGEEDCYAPVVTYKLEVDSEAEWGLFEIELNCKKETKDTKKQKERFYGRKNPELKKKKSKCTVS